MDYLQYKKVFEYNGNVMEVLNLIINGLPSIYKVLKKDIKLINVLNLIINGLPSIFLQCFG
mgnify:CR=1 FL=1